MHVRVFGPAYLDRVLHVDGPLREGPPIDRSAEGTLQADGTADLSLLTETGGVRVKPLPKGWPGPFGRVELRAPGLALSGLTERKGLSWHDDLGGMGAGFAAALRGELSVVLGDPNNATTRAVLSLLSANGIVVHPTFRAGLASDWTLLVTSGPYGDKLPVGFRGVLLDAPDWVQEEGPVDLLWVAGLTNRLAASTLLGPATVRVFAPTMRNMLDDDPPIALILEGVHVLSCNREEWLACPDRDEAAQRLNLLVVTDGPRGATIQLRQPSGKRLEFTVPAFPRARPPRDTNRAGEAFASTLVRGLWDVSRRLCTWDEPRVRVAAERAAVAAALVLDLERFGFPTDDEIDEAQRVGAVS